MHVFCPAQDSSVSSCPGLISVYIYVLSSRVKLEHGKKFACIISGTISRMIVILRQHPLVKSIFDCAELTKACAKQPGSCGRGYEIIRRNFNRLFLFCKRLFVCLRTTLTLRQQLITQQYTYK